MFTQTTEGVKVTVESIYQPEYSTPENGHFMYAYKVCIENLSAHSVQLLSRHWYIFDGYGKTHEVKGEGVVGLQPIIPPGERHIYVSGCHLSSDMGSMRGSYTMRRVHDDTKFEVSIPRFNLAAPYRLN